MEDRLQRTYATLTKQPEREETTQRSWLASMLRTFRGTELPSDDDSANWGPWGLVALAIVFNLWVLRAEALPVRQLNDGVVHQSMIHWALGRIQSGHLTFDGWFPYLQLGSSWFHHYQSLPHTLTGYLSVAVGQDGAYSGTLYVLLVTWPISVYLGARLLGWERWIAAGAALLSPLIVSTPGYGFEHGSYTWRGLGVWSQLWAMWLLPLAWGFSWRAVSGRSRSLAIAALFVGLTAACHFITGYMALLMLPIWVVIKPSEFLRRLGRAALVGSGAVLIIAWVVVPLLADSEYSTISRYMRGTFWYDSFGARQVFGWLISGQLFDGSNPGRLPVVSILVAIGAIVCIVRARKDERARALLIAFVLGLFLFSGRATFGSFIDLIPGMTDIFIHRFISLVHLAGLFLAGVGAGWVVGLMMDYVPRPARVSARVAAAAAAFLVAMVAIAPAWAERAAFDGQGAGWLHNQRAADATEGTSVEALVAEAESMGPGRMFAGASGGATPPPSIYSVPLYSYLLYRDADTIGMYLRTPSLSEDVEANFDSSDAAQFDLFNIRYVILPAGQEPVVPADLVDTEGSFSLWVVPTTGYLRVVDTLPPIEADRTNLSERVEAFTRSTLPADGRFPAISFAGEPGAPSTLAGAAGSDPPGTVISEATSLEDGVASAEVELERPGMVILKATFDPRWTVEVDGEALTPQMVAPSFVGRQVPAGRHSIVFAYQPFPRYDVLFAVGILTFVALLLAPRWSPRGRHRKRHGAS